MPLINVSVTTICLSLLIVLDSFLKRTPMKVFTTSGLEVCGNLSLNCVAQVHFIHIQPGEISIFLKCVLCQCLCWYF